MGRRELRRRRSRRMRPERKKSASSAPVIHPPYGSGQKGSEECFDNQNRFSTHPMNCTAGLRRSRTFLFSDVRPTCHAHKSILMWMSLNGAFYEIGSVSFASHPLSKWQRRSWQLTVKRTFSSVDHSEALYISIFTHSHTHIHTQELPCCQPAQQDQM